MATVDSDGALAGIRVLDAGILVQGPQAGQLLSDLGADVIKVELPGVGDYSRWLPASATDRRPPWFVACNRGKRSLAVDLRTARGAALFLDLADHADVVISNFRPGTMESWGLGYDQLSAANPKVIYATASAFGAEGDRAGQAGLDLGGQAAAGLVGMTGAPDSQGYPVGVAIGDHLGALNLVIGVLAALLYRSRTGYGQQVSTSLLGSLICAQGPEITGYALSGTEPRPAGNGHSLLGACYGIFTTSDGRIAITDVPQKASMAFWRHVGVPQSMARAGLADAVGGELRSGLYDKINAGLRTRPTEYWCAIFSSLGIVHAVVRDYHDVLSDPASYRNGFLRRVAHPQWGDTVVPGTAIALSRSKVQPGEHLAAAGEHGEQILRQLLCLSPAEISALRAEGVI
jgi:crotonobetainyl-CoA:carnitine CoA-transferase CaiB-like acyl-CoA transferase